MCNNRWGDKFRSWTSTNMKYPQTPPSGLKLSYSHKSCNAAETYMILHILLKAML